MTFGERRFVAGLALVLSFVAANARAANPTDVATARELYKDGADALDAQNPKLAVEKLSQAWSLVQTPVIGTDLARARRALGQLVEAREAVLAVQRIPPQPDETVRSTQARAEADKIAVELATRIPHVKLVVEGVGENHTATVKLDGEIIPPTALGITRQANPGERTATLDTDDGRHASGSATLAEGETKEITLTVPPPAAPAETTTPTIVVETHAQAPEKPVVAPRSSRVSPIVWIGIAFAGVGLATGAITGALALNEASIVKAKCGGNGVCLPPYTSDLDAANALATVSTIAFITVGVGAALIITGFVLGGGKSDATKRARILPFVGPISGVGGVF